MDTQQRGPNQGTPKSDPRTRNQGLNPNSQQLLTIGARWPGIIAGIYAGVARGENGKPDAHLVLLDANPTGRMSWATAKKWAEDIAGSARLPTRFESALLYANLRDQFELDEWYWTGSLYESSPSYAWSQLFGDGSQGRNHQLNEFRARAVSSFPVNS